MEAKLDDIKKGATIGQSTISDNKSGIVLNSQTLDSKLDKDKFASFVAILHDESIIPLQNKASKAENDI